MLAAEISHLPAGLEPIEKSKKTRGRGIDKRLEPVQTSCRGTPLWSYDYVITGEVPTQVAKLLGAHRHHRIIGASQARIPHRRFECEGDCNTRALLALPTPGRPSHLHSPI